MLRWYNKATGRMWQQCWDGTTKPLVGCGSNTEMIQQSHKIMWPALVSYTLLSKSLVVMTPALRWCDKTTAKCGPLWHAAACSHQWCDRSKQRGGDGTRKPQHDVVSTDVWKVTTTMSRWYHKTETTESQHTITYICIGLFFVLFGHYNLGCGGPFLHDFKEELNQTKETSQALLVGME